VNCEDMFCIWNVWDHIKKSEINTAPRYDFIFIVSLRISLRFKYSVTFNDSDILGTANGSSVFNKN